MFGEIDLSGLPIRQRRIESQKQFTRFENSLVQYCLELISECNLNFSINTNPDIVFEWSNVDFLEKLNGSCSKISWNESPAKKDDRKAKRVSDKPSLTMTQTARASLDWYYKGMRALVLENRYLRIVYLLDKGADIIELKYKPLDVDLMWHSPQGYVNPVDYVPAVATADSSFNDLYGGGWQDAVPVIGNGPQEHRGAKYGTHGESPVLRWDCEILEEDGQSASAVLRVEGIRYPFRLEKTVRIDSDRATLHNSEKLSNLSPQPLEFFWLQHPSFGEPFLNPGDTIEIPSDSEVVNLQEFNPNGRIAGGSFQWPKAGSRNGGADIDLSVLPPRDLVAEETIFIRVKKGWYALKNPMLGLSFKLEWDPSIFRWIWFWQNYNLPDYPYYGAAWNIAIEPATSPPTDIARKRGDDALKIAGKSSIETEFEATISAN
jgi:hypothetical protein